MPPARAGSTDGRAARVDAGLRELLAPIVQAAGLDLEALSVKPVGRRNLVRVVVDGDGGVDLDRVAEVSRELSNALDAEDGTFSEPFVLEVTTPGVDRPLTEPRHWRRALGRLVRVEVDGKPVEGRVLAADDSGAELVMGVTRSHLRWDQLGPGKVQVEFNHASDAHGDELDADDFGDTDDAAEDE